MLAHEAWLALRMQSGRMREHLCVLHATPPSGAPRSASYLLFDWHEGQTLEALLAGQQGVAVQKVLAMAIGAARALGLLHRQSVVHRDIKPANMHWGTDGVLRILDLGVALSGRESAAARALHAGTPSYMNPEQWGLSGSVRGEPEAANAQSDLFALGVVLYQLLCKGRLPYGEVLPYQAGRYHRDPAPPSRINAQVPIWLDNLVLRAIARNPAQRFETAEEMLLALERGAARPLQAPLATPLIHRDPRAVWQLALALSALFNVLMLVWLLFLPKN